MAEKHRSPNTRVQRTRSSPSAHRSPLTRYPLGRRSLSGRAIAGVLGAFLSFTLQSGLLAQGTRDCPYGTHQFPETGGRVVVAAGAVAQLRQPLTFTVVVRDDEGQCALIKKVLVKKLSKAFPTWRHVAGEEAAEITITYQGGFSLCVDDCDAQPLPQGAYAEVTLGSGSFRANWSDESHWRSRSRLVDLFVESLARLVHGAAA